MNRLEISFGTPLRIVVAAAPPAGFALLAIYDGLCSYTAEGTIMYTMPILHGVKLQVSYVDSAGNPAKIDGAVTWTTSDSTVVTLQPDADDTTVCGITSTDNVGQAQITATADADLGEGVRELITICDVTVVAGEAVAGTIAPVGAAEPIAPQPIR